MKMEEGDAGRRKWKGGDMERKTYDGGGKKGEKVC